MERGLFDLTGKVALVTGGNGGLGLGFARGIARQGGDVVIWGRSAEKNTAAAEALAAFGGRVGTQQVDVARESEIVEGYRALLDEFGRIDCVIANAGLPPNASSLLDMSTADYHALLDINQHGAFYTLREGARHMVQRAEGGEPGGSLVFCGSLSMFQGIPGKQNYAAAKGAMGAVIRCMAVEFGRYGIRANTVAPGYTKTEMTGPDEELSPVDQYFASKTPIARPGYPDDFEGIAAYLASDASRWHSGDTIVIDGAALINL